MKALRALNERELEPEVATTRAHGLDPWLARSYRVQARLDLHREIARLRTAGPRQW